MKLFKLKETNLYFLLSQLSVLLKGGVPLTKALDLLALQKKEVSEKLIEIKLAIEQGASISEAFKRANLFPEFVCEMLLAAQTGTSLEEILQRTSDWLQKMEEFKAKILNALIYPSIVITLSIVAVIVVLEFIVPKLRKILLSFGQDLPLASKLLIWFAGMLWWCIILGIPLVIFLYVYLKKRGKVEVVYEKLLKLPIVGSVWQTFELTKWCYTLSLLLNTGVVLPKAVEISANTCQNRFIKESLKSIIPLLYEGNPLSKVLKEIPFVPEFLIEVCVVGEETGRLGEMLFYASDFFSKDIEEKVTFVLRWIEPLAILVLGSIIAYIIVSVILPIMKISTVIK